MFKERLLLVILVCGSYVSHLQAGSNSTHVVSLTIENDLLYNPAPGKHHDRHYTQGLKLIYMTADDPVPRWMQKISFSEFMRAPRDGEVSSSFGVVLGHNIYTPEDYAPTNVIRTDRPYAAWLYTGLALQNRNTPAHSVSTLESFELNIGVIGPEAQGEWPQNEVHRIREFPTFDGWDNQLKTEPAFVLKYGRAWRFSYSTAEEKRIMDAIPHIGCHLGTVAISADAGLTLRIGWNLPDDFGVQKIDSPILLSASHQPQRWGVYIFGRMDGRAVARNAFLDGNLFQDSHRVDKKPLVADFSYGLALLIGKRCEISYTFLSRTPEFRGQKEHDRFGSLSAKWQWGF